MKRFVLALLVGALLLIIASPALAKISLSVVPTRTSCVAPCAVFFDATGTTGLSGATSELPGGDYINAYFTWNFDVTNVAPSDSHRTTIGSGVAHVFQTAGTYTVSTAVKDSVSSDSTTTTITVTAMSGTKYYVASNGNDSNNCTSTSTPCLTQAHAFSIGFAANNSILFRNGDTFSVSSFISISGKTGPTIIGGYSDPGAPSVVAPVFSLVNTDGFLVTNSSTDIRFVDIHVSGDATSGIPIGIGQGTAAATNTLLLRVEGQSADTGNEVVFSAPDADGIFIQDSHFHDFHGYSYFADSPTHVGYIGNLVDHWDTDHGFRLEGCTELNQPTPGTCNNLSEHQASLEYVAENTIAANTVSPPISNAQFRGDNTKIVCVNNTFNQNTGFQPQNSTGPEYVQNGLFEGNYQNPGATALIAGHGALQITARHIVVRNNFFINTASIGVTPQGNVNTVPGWVDGISVYNNTFYYPADGGSTQFAVLDIHNVTNGSFVGGGNIFMTNNLTWNGQTGSSSSAFVTTDGSGTFTNTFNITYAPNNGSFVMPSGTGNLNSTNPILVSTPTTLAGSIPSVLGLQNSSPAKNAGTTTEAWYDYNGVSRPQGSAFDMGALEFVVNNSTSLYWYHVLSLLLFLGAAAGAGVYVVQERKKRKRLADPYHFQQIASTLDQFQAVADRIDEHQKQLVE